MLGNSGVAVQLAASQEGPGFMELVRDVVLNCKFHGVKNTLLLPE
jgi:hypothetical protein